jgi:hypothetical protein
MALSLRASMRPSALAQGRPSSRTPVRLLAARPAPAGRLLVLRRSTNGDDQLDLERVAKIEEEITRQARAVAAPPRWHAGGGARRN